MYDFKIINLPKKILGTVIYFICAFVLWNIADIISANIYLAFYITIYEYDVIKYLLFELFSVPLLCGYVMFLIKDDSNIKNIFDCYLSKRYLGSTFIIFAIFNLPCILLKFISALTVSETLKFVFAVIILIIGLQLNYQMVDFAATKKFGFKLFFGKINYKNLLVTVLILTPVYILYIVLNGLFDSYINSVGVMGDFISKELLYGVQLIIMPVYYTFFYKNVYKHMS